MRVLVALVGLLMVAHSDGIAVTPTLELRAPPPAAAVTRVLGYPRYTHIHTQRHGTAACMALPPTPTLDASDHSRCLSSVGIPPYMYT